MLLFNGFEVRKMKSSIIYLYNKERAFSMVNEIIFQIQESPEGGYEAKALGYSVFTEGDDYEDIKKNIKDAVLCHFDEGESPRIIIGQHRCKTGGAK